jgi:hypothetical protein
MKATQNVVLYIFLILMNKSITSVMNIIWVDTILMMNNALIMIIGQTQGINLTDTMDRESTLYFQ